MGVKSAAIVLVFVVLFTVLSIIGIPPKPKPSWSIQAPQHSVEDNRG